VKSSSKIGGCVYGERVKSQILAKEEIKIKAGRTMDFDKEKFYF